MSDERDERLDRAMDLLRPAARAAGLSQDAYLVAVLEGRLPPPGVTAALTPAARRPTDPPPAPGPSIPEPAAARAPEPAPAPAPARAPEPAPAAAPAPAPAPAPSSSAPEPGSSAPVPVTPTAQLYLHRFSVKPGHLDAFRHLLPRLVGLWDRHGTTTHRLFLETQAEPKLTWLYECADRDATAAAVADDPDATDLDALLAPHVFRNATVRPVAVERLTHATTAAVEGRIAIMRRYAITGSWDEFLGIWRQIVTVREEYGFRCLFAVADRPKDLFTWAFDVAGAWDDVAAAQRPYYHDPRRVALRGVFDYMADYTITPAEQILLN